MKELTYDDKGFSFLDFLSLDFENKFYFLNALEGCEAYVFKIVMKKTIW
jgi:hypothetical protein